MSNILQTLKTASVNRHNHLSPIIQRRNKLLASIGVQCDAALAQIEGRQHSIKRVCRIRNSETGETINTVKETSVRPSWFTAEDGKLYLEVRYGYKPLEIAKGKTSIDVGDWSNLIPTLQLVRKATEVGEFDGQLNDAFVKLAAQLKGKRNKVSK